MDDYDIYRNDTRQPPFDFKIKKLKQYLKMGGMDKHDINKAVSLYKKKVYDRVAEVENKLLINDNDVKGVKYAENK